MAKFTLGAALLYEELTGKSMTEIGTPKVTDLVCLLYPGEYKWQKREAEGEGDRPDAIRRRKKRKWFL